METENIRKGIVFNRHFTKEKTHPFDEVEWNKRDAIIVSSEKKIVFEQKNVEFPIFYSQRAVDIIVSKYFKGKLGTSSRETSYKQLINRVVNTNVKWGEEQGYFSNEQSKNIYSDELTYILLHQMVSFNSPVWFNMGFPGRPQTSSACFINEVKDDMDSILDWYKKEGTIFKMGSGSGINVSPLRAKGESLSAGGTSSGVLSFMKVADANASSIKSGGSARRAAKMIIMDVDHPEIIDFIQCKVKEEEKALALIREGYDSSFNGEAYSTVAFQNENHSVMVTNEFMEKTNKKRNREFWTKYVSTGKKCKQYDAQTILVTMTEAAWRTGCPGIQFEDTINKWNTCKTKKIKASNPCSEYFHIDNTSCNLASINLMKFFDLENDKFLIDDFVVVVYLITTAQDIWIDKSDYPNDDISTETKKYRTVGIGYSNLGALIMANGLAYDSDEAREYTSAITSLMSSVAYYRSADHCSSLPCFPEYNNNKDYMIEILNMHKTETGKIHKSNKNKDIVKLALEYWRKAIVSGEKNGYRNSYVSNIAPTGTLSLMMDCDTTGCEPELALVKYKRLAGSDAVIQIVNDTVRIALKRLKYSDEEIEDIVNYIREKNTIEKCPKIKEEHLSIFCTSFKGGGKKYIDYMGHVKMLGAIQPFVSGGISKTCNIPEEATKEDINNIFQQAWEMGLKSITIFRDNCRQSQPITTLKEQRSRATRIKLPDDVSTSRHKFAIGGTEIFLHHGIYPDGTLGEIFFRVAKEGSTMSGLMDAFSREFSISLQYGIPLKILIEKLINSKFDPMGWTGNKDIPNAHSVIDYAMRFLALKYLDEKERESVGIYSRSEKMENITNKDSEKHKEASFIKEKEKTKQTTSTTCPMCGSIMVFSGSCKFCENCGNTTGCS